jgi:hypothetical protein
MRVISYFNKVNTFCKLLIAAEESQMTFQTLLSKTKYLNIIILIGIFKIDFTSIGWIWVVTFDSSKSTVDKVANA